MLAHKVLIYAVILLHPLLCNLSYTELSYTDVHELATIAESVLQKF